MKTYVKYRVNKVTGEIQHCITSSKPIAPHITVTSKSTNLQPDPEFDDFEEEITTPDIEGLRHQMCVKPRKLLREKKYDPDNKCICDRTVKEIEEYDKAEELGKKKLRAAMQGN